MGATAIEECRQDLTDGALPGWINWFVWLMIPLLMLPPVLIFRAMGQTSTHTRLHFMPDMDWQEKSKTQTMSPDMGSKFNPDYLFEDMRAMRQPIPGTVGRGQLETDLEYFKGIRAGSSPVTVTTNNKAVRTALGALQEEGQDAAAVPTVEEPDWVTEFPSKVVVDADLLKRGQERFNIYCTVCHGYAGNGDGQVNQRALALAATGQANWTAAKSLHDPEVKENHVGRIFDTISNGRGTMGPYKDQIPVADRWAIVAYVKALQNTGIKPPVVVLDENVEP